MQIIPIIPQPRVGVDDTLEVKGVAAANPAKKVGERTLPPMVSHRYRQLPQLPNEKAQLNKRRTLPMNERRLFCRRLTPRSLLLELRSSIERRRRKGRAADLAMHIDEKA